jgi:hypothetical protein
MEHHDTGEIEAQAGFEDSGLSTSEDHELRQLAWFRRAGQLSERSENRLSELSSKDRRSEVRDPRPNPANPQDEEQPSTLPPLQPDRVATIICPNCGWVMADQHHRQRTGPEREGLAG